MTSNYSRRFPPQYNRKIVEYIVGFCIALLGGLFLTNGDHSILLSGIALFSLIVYHFPLVLITTHFLVFIFPSVLIKYFDNTTAWKFMFNGINISYIILGIMVAAILIRLGFTIVNTLRKHRADTIDIKLWVPFTALGLWFLYGIIRNLDIYGLSAPGEFRSHYLVLAVPVYIAFFFDSPQKRKTLFKTVLLFCLVVPILCIPVIGETKGWTIGANNRFLPADISFGIFQGLFFCFLSNKYGYTKFPPFLHWAVSLAAILIILFDTHRSVWFSGIIMGIAYIVFDKKINLPTFNKVLGYAFIVITVIFLSSATTTLMLDKGLLEFITERGQDLFIIEDNSDSTWVWRMERWKMEMEKIADSPLTGLGFGGYWGKENFLRTGGTSPHNLYIQIFVKLGLVGLLLYLAVIARIFQKMYQAIALIRKTNDPEFVILIIGMIALIGSHTYYMAYSFDSYSLFFIGLGMATINAKAIKA